MLTLYSTEKIISTIYYNPGDKYTHWLDFIKRLRPDLYILLDPDSTYDTDDTDVCNPLFELKHANDLRTITDKSDVQLKAYINHVIDCDVTEIENPQTVFLLDIDSNTAAEISSKYGVICHAFGDPIDECPLLQDTITRSMDSNESKVGWSELLSDSKAIFPSNSLILMDRYLFSKCKGQTVQDGIKNVFDILNYILPHKLSIDYHILLIFDKDQIDFSYRNSSDQDPFSRISLELYELKKALRRPYNILFEVLSIDKDGASEHYNKTHNRRILSNYFIISADHSLRAFRGDKSLYDQVLRLSWAASEGVIKSPKSDAPAKELRSYITSIYKIIGNIKKYQVVHFSQNGCFKGTVKEIKNRLITQ